MLCCWRSREQHMSLQVSRHLLESYNSGMIGCPADIPPCIAHVAIAESSLDCLPRTASCWVQAAALRSTAHYLIGLQTYFLSCQKG